MTLQNAFGSIALDASVIAVRDAITDLTHTAVPQGEEPGIVVRGAGAHIDRISFAKTLSGVDPEWGTVRKTGSGMTVNQTGGNLVITTGTTANSETIIRGLETFKGGVRLRQKTTLTQRIAKNSFFVELVDVVANAASITINSAVLVTVTATAHGLDSTYVGQSMYLGGYTGTGTFVPGRYAIASVPDANTMTFTVAGFAAGSGTVDLFGLNYYHLLYDATTHATAKFDTQRNGRNLGETTVTINTTATGHLAVILGNDAQATLLDGPATTQTGVQFTTRASRVENVPDDKNLVVQLRAVNGSSSPASSTTWTIGMVSVSNFSALDTTIQDLRPAGNMSALPVQVANTVPISGSISGTVTANQGTMVAGTAYSAVTTASTNAAIVKGSVGNLFELTISNPTATPAFVKLYNKALAPTVGTDVPVWTISIPATTDRQFSFSQPGKRFSGGIAIAVTAAAPATDTAVAVAGIQIHGTYI